MTLQVILSHNQVTEHKHTVTQYRQNPRDIIHDPQNGHYQLKCYNTIQRCQTITTSALTATLGT